MRVLLLTTHLNTGGIGSYTVNLAGYLKKAGIDVAVASSGGILESKLKDSGISHATIDIKTKAEFGFKIFKALPSLLNLVDSGNFDLVHAQTRVAQVAGQLVKSKTGVPLVTTCHGFFKHRRLARRIFPCWGDKVIAISQSVSRHLVEDFGVDPDRVSLVYSGIDLGRYSVLKSGQGAAELKKSTGISEDAFLVGSIGRLSPEKGYTYLIEAFKRALEKRPSMQLLIVGEGREKDLLTEQARESGISGRVFFVNGNDAPLEEYLSLMDVFCLVSLSEGLGLSLIEAMAAGRACIVSNVGGLAELVLREKDGIIVPPKDAGALSEAILRLAENAALRKKLGDAAREKAMNNFSIERSGEETVKVYRQALKSRQ
jgi:glycosyltransferase involved in cell wall biosynthesis